VQGRLNGAVGIKAQTYLPAGGVLTEAQSKVKAANNYL